MTKHMRRYPRRVSLQPMRPVCDCLSVLSGIDSLWERRCPGARRRAIFAAPFHRSPFFRL